MRSAHRRGEKSIPPSVPLWHRGGVFSGVFRGERQSMRKQAIKSLRSYHTPRNLHLPLSPFLDRIKALVRLVQLKLEGQKTQCVLVLF